MTDRHVAFAAIRARMRWQRNPDMWTVRCRDVLGRPARVRIRIIPTGIVLTPDTLAPLLLSPLQVGRLRAGLRDAAITFAGLDGLVDDSPVEEDCDVDPVDTPRRA
ncbi:MAG: hypothetical protein M3443_19550 [Actinomycetota bacterium]|nr:hypothetical protein [Actinomycetota bacterium]